MAQFLISKRTAIYDPADHFNLLETQIEILPSVRGIGIKFLRQERKNPVGAHNADWCPMSDGRRLRKIDDDYLFCNT
jgi:hypothetical protein